MIIFQTFDIQNSNHNTNWHRKWMPQRKNENGQEQILIHHFCFSIYPQWMFWLSIVVRFIINLKWSNSPYQRDQIGSRIPALKWQCGGMLMMMMFNSDDWEIEQHALERAMMTHDTKSKNSHGQDTDTQPHFAKPPKDRWLGKPRRSHAITRKPTRWLGIMKQNKYKTMRSQRIENDREGLCSKTHNIPSDHPNPNRRHQEQEQHQNTRQRIWSIKIAKKNLISPCWIIIIGVSKTLITILEKILFCYWMWAYPHGTVINSGRFNVHWIPLKVEFIWLISLEFPEIQPCELDNKRTCAIWTLLFKPNYLHN